MLQDWIIIFIAKKLTQRQSDLPAQGAQRASPHPFRYQAYPAELPTLHITTLPRNTLPSSPALPEWKIKMKIYFKKLAPRLKHNQGLPTDFSLLFLCSLPKKPFTQSQRDLLSHRMLSAADSISPAPRSLCSANMPISSLFF